MRVGIGYDIHKLAEGRKLVLGGVIIPNEKGPLGHSDADVLLHAVCDAILGAAGLGDIGTHFPDGDPKYKDISSTRLLRKVNELSRQKGYSVNNIDTVLIAEKPKISRYTADMKKEIAAVLGIDLSHIGIKATTNEALGPIGKDEAIASWAVVTLEENSKS